LNGLADLTNALLAYTVALPRLVTALILLPAFSPVVITGMLRNGLAASLALFVLPVVAADATLDSLSPGIGLALFVKEAVIGLLLGFGVAVLFWAIESTGFFIDNTRGTSMASSLDPLTGSQTSPLGNLFTQALTAIFFVGGGFVAFLGVLYESYAVWPVFSFYPSMDLAAAPYFVGLFDRVLFLAVVCGAPVIIAMLMAEFALALITRFAPQLNVFFLAMPIKSGIAMLILVVYLGTLMRFFSADLIGAVADFSLLQRLLQ
jgi:type III secretion protein T